MKQLRTTLPALLLVAVPALLQAQPATGLPAFGSFSGGPFDTINNANLNAHFAIPIVNKAGVGLPFTYTLTYDSSVWYPATSGSSLAWTPVPNWGWQAVTAVATGYVSFVLIPQYCKDQYGIPHSWNVYAGFQYYDQFAAIHPFNAEISSFNFGAGWLCGGGPPNLRFRRGRERRLRVHDLSLRVAWPTHRESELRPQQLQGHSDIRAYCAGGKFVNGPRIAHGPKRQVHAISPAGRPRRPFRRRRGRGANRPVSHASCESRACAGPGVRGRLCGRRFDFGFAACVCWKNARAVGIGAALARASDPGELVSPGAENPLLSLGSRSRVCCFSSARDKQTDTPKSLAICFGRGAGVSGHFLRLAELSRLPSG